MDTASKIATTQSRPRHAVRSKRRPAQVTAAIGYVRVSTTEQADSGLSLEAQRARIEAQAAAHGWDLIAIYEDAGASARTLERTGLNAALNALKPGHVLIAVRLDRLTRSVPDLYLLDELVSARGAEWATIAERMDTTTATGRMLRTLIATMAEWEREIIGERTSAAMMAKRARGERLGATPLGYVTLRSEDGTTQVLRHTEEQRTVERVRALRAEGLSLRKIAAKLTQEGRQTKRGGQWDCATVRRLLKPRLLEEMGVTAEVSI